MLAIIFLISILAGFIDAIAGGGGLILVPALLLAGLPATNAIATNKIFNVVSSFTSFLKFWRGGTLSWPHFKAMVGPGLAGSLFGTMLLSSLSRKQAEPVVSILLVLIAILVIFKKDFGGVAKAQRGMSIRKWLMLSVSGLAIGVHDGFFGPGAGIFLIFALIQLGGLNFLQATSTAKLINFFTSSLAATAFLLQGAVSFKFAMLGSVGVMLGSFAGASYAGARGSAMIRPVFLLVAVTIAIKLVLA